MAETLLLTHTDLDGVGCAVLFTGAGPAGGLYRMGASLTSASSRFWPMDQNKTGLTPPSFDKQFVRDWLEKQPWNKKAPAPRLPADIIAKTAEKYREALRLLTT